MNHVVGLTDNLLLFYNTLIFHLLFGNHCLFFSDPHRNKLNFEKNNQKTNGSIQLLQKKLEKYQGQLKVSTKTESYSIYFPFVSLGQALVPRKTS